jgi:hypothetical protein
MMFGALRKETEDNGWILETKKQGHHFRYQTNKL